MHFARRVEACPFDRLRAVPERSRRAPTAHNLSAPATPPLVNRVGSGRSPAKPKTPAHSPGPSAPSAAASIPSASRRRRGPARYSTMVRRHKAHHQASRDGFDVVGYHAASGTSSGNVGSVSETPCLSEPCGAPPGTCRIQMLKREGARDAGDDLHGNLFAPGAYAQYSAHSREGGATCSTGWGRIT